MLTERQRTAESLAREIAKMGAWVVSPMPLDDSAKLRFQVLDADRDKVLEKLSSWNWSPALLSTGPRFCIDGTTKTASLYEVDLPPERQVIPADDRIYGEIGREKLSEEVKAMLKAVGMGPKK